MPNYYQGVNSEIIQHPVIQQIVKSLEDRKGKDIVILNTGKAKGAVWDFFVICSGDSTTQVQALAEHVEEETRRNTSVRPLHIEGLQNCEWVLLDYSDVAVHIFLPERREFYGLEYLWVDVPHYRIDQKI